MSVGPDWHRARGAATDLGRARVPRSVPTGLGRALGQVLAVEVRAVTDLPVEDVSATDGWAVSGPGPWRVSGAGARLGPGRAADVSTGSPLPRGAEAVVRLEHGRLEYGVLSAPRPAAGADVRSRGEEAAAGEVLLGKGRTLGPAALGLVAASGADSVHVVVAPRSVLLVTGDELVGSGPTGGGRVRDSLGHVLPGLLDSLGVDLVETARSGDDPASLRDVFGGPYRSTVDLVVTTGGTAAGRADQVRGALLDVGARMVVDGMAVRPGGSSLLAVVPDGPVVLALPGSPLAAVAALLTLLPPLLDGWLGRPAPAVRPVGTTSVAQPGTTRLVPARLDVESGTAVGAHGSGPGMLRGLADAEGLLVLHPDGSTDWLPLPLS